jgi:hypothetical protein
MGELLVTVIILACVAHWVWPLPQLRRLFSVKQPATVPAPRPIARELRSDAVELPPELPELRGSEPPVDGSEPVYVTREELVRALALVVITDDGGRQLSQDIISRAAGISKERTGQLVREMRGQPDPAPAPGPVLRVRDHAGERLIPREG